MYHCETEDVTEKVFLKIGAKNQKENMILNNMLQVFNIQKICMHHL